MPARTPLLAHPVHPHRRVSERRRWKARSSAGTSIRCASEWNRPSGSLCARSTTLSSDVDMNSSVNASAMFPQLRLTSARAAFARPGPHATAFPDVFAPMQPSDSLAPLRSPLRSSPRHRTYLGTQGLFFTARTGAPAVRCNAGDISTPAPPLPALSRGESRVSQVPGPSSSCVPWSSTPPGAKRPSPALGAPAVAFKSPETLGTRNRSLSWLYISRPTRSRTYASPSPLPFPAQGSLPARAGSPLAGRDSHPLDDKQGFVESTHTPFLLDQPRLVAPGVGL